MCATIYPSAANKTPKGTVGTLTESALLEPNTTCIDGRPVSGPSCMAQLYLRIIVKC